MTSWSRFSLKDQKKKYGNEKTELDGYSFGSMLEASIYQMLKYRALAHELTIDQVQDHVHLSLARILYVPDFKCMSLTTHEPFWVEAKGFEAPRWPTIKKLWKFYGPGPLEIWKGDHRNPRLVETIIPHIRSERES